MAIIEKVFGVIMAFLIGGVFIYLGYNTFIGAPVVATGSKTGWFNIGQTWLIELVGMTTAGAIAMGLGGLLWLFIIRDALRRRDT